MGEARHSSVRRSRWHNLEQLRACHSSAEMTRLILDSLSVFCTVLRVHDSGDFFSLAYMSAWVAAARSRANTTFYFYTKSLRYWLAHRDDIGDGYPKVSLPLTCIADREFFFTVCAQGRVHTNLTNLSRELRPFVRHAGRPLWAADVANSQPLLMALTLRADAAIDPGLAAYTQWLAAPHTPPPNPSQSPLPYVGTYSGGSQSDLDRFLEVCVEGQLYERLMDRTGYDRATVKEKFFAVAYGKPEQAATTRVGQAFAAEFPAAWAAVREVNGRDNAAVARRMQAVESYICVLRTCARLMAEFPDAPMYTLHDGLPSQCLGFLFSVVGGPLSVEEHVLSQRIIQLSDSARRCVGNKPSSSRNSALKPNVIARRRSGSKPNSHDCGRSRTERKSPRIARPRSRPLMPPSPRCARNSPQR
ncbi:hypothetical protein GobsT_24560 [Gemmata obscuriglobus]|uniref:Gene product 88 domain-containing protein n=2 Tax=Gemmata obscuriglobus TaxID=114 RepID=A0A2Z3H6N9_9BACT